MRAGFGGIVKHSTNLQIKHSRNRCLGNVLAIGDFEKSVELGIEDVSDTYSSCPTKWRHRTVGISNC